MRSYGELLIEYEKAQQELHELKCKLYKQSGNGYLVLVHECNHLCNKITKLKLDINKARLQEMNKKC